MRLLEHGALALSAQADVAESVRAWESGDISSVIFLPSPARSRWSPREHGITFRQPTGAWSLERFEEFKAKQQPLWSLFGQLLVCAGRSPHQRRSRRDSTPLHSRRHSRHAPSLQFACCFRLVRIRFCVLARSTLRALRRRRDGCRRWWKLLQLRTRRFSRPRSSHYFTRMSTVLGSFPQVRATSARSRMASTPRLSTRQAPAASAHAFTSWSSRSAACTMPSCCAPVTCRCWTIWPRSGAGPSLSCPPLSPPARPEPEAHMSAETQGYSLVLYAMPTV
jgi:hypothetical protein